jgi:hypothetical protein
MDTIFILSNIKQALCHKKKSHKRKGERPNGVAILPYERSISNKISRLLSNYNINSTHIVGRETAVDSGPSRTYLDGGLPASTAFPASDVRFT